MKILQINLNRSRGAQDLMLQYIKERKIEIALVSEPSRFPRGNWLGDVKGLAAVHWGGGALRPCETRGGICYGQMWGI